MPEIRIELPAETLESIRIAAEQERVDHLLHEGLNSGPARPMSASDWEELSRRVHERNSRAD